MTSYTPAWRARRDHGAPKTNGDIELEVTGNDDDAVADKDVSNKDGGGYINESYVHHREEVIGSRM